MVICDHNRIRHLLRNQPPGVVFQSEDDIETQLLPSLMPAITGDTNRAIDIYGASPASIIVISRVRLPHSDLTGVEDNDSEFLVGFPRRLSVYLLGLFPGGTLLFTTNAACTYTNLGTVLRGILSFFVERDIFFLGSLRVARACIEGLLLQCRLYHGAGAE